MKKLLLTGFEPFLEYKVNPTERIVKDLDQQTVGAFRINSRVLPVDFSKSASQLVAYVEELKPDAVIALGLAAGRSMITPERIAINVNSGVVDNTGYLPEDEWIEAEGNDGYFSTLPIRKMVETLQTEGIPAKVSNTAGTYLCNNVMYTLLHHYQKNGKDVPCGFIHIPASFELAVQHRDLPAWPLPTLQNAIELAIGVLD